MSAKESGVVEAPCGPVQGKTFTFEDGKSVSAFLGIPFAKPPVGELRFKKPVPADHWTTVKKCDKFSPAFPYVSVFPGRELELSEEFLTVNVFAPEPIQQGQKKYPVLFYIHGGGFLIDDVSMLGDEGICKNLCSKDIVVVSIDYRLGIFGFFTLENEDVKGNYGMWDMALALKWTKQNILAFGGDPDKITVAGQSAGAAASDLLALSPITRDLFIQFISFAGTSFAEWLYMDSSHSRKVMIEYAKHLGAEITDSTTEEVNKQVFDFFKSCDASKLAVGIHPNPEFKFYPQNTLPLGPCFDGEFFPKPLEELRKEAPKKNVINGVTECEGLLFASAKVMQPELTFKQLVSQVLYSIRPDLPLDANHKFCTNALEKHNEEDELEHAKHCMNVASDFMFNAGAIKMTESYVSHGSTVYNYVFSYFRKGTLGLLEPALPFGAATHCMELPYLFGKSLFGGYEFKEEDREIVDRFTTYITNFIKTGDPNSSKFPEKWNPSTKGHEGTYFLFGQNEFCNRDNFCGGDRAKKWDRIFKENPRKSHI
ncbi:Carboxylesterase domain containing protein [Aphelenchoides bicaudatus]|nr:Carboxylesterase domain containing protein [Aphelenchoides bicaudatus]